ncbi:unnamed protein product [Schistosoma margrebowiei]|uniref:Uncharacterized protein n=1 Tax=Schistosoma margrebowiei TaxID=48269 RepID=A0A183MY17_9TREM|nr:unnamed protein product [Schistosoma margrebowiei]
MQGPYDDERAQWVLTLHRQACVSEMLVNFLESCIENNDYPKRFWKALRRNHIHPNAKTLKRHALNYIDGIKSRKVELNRNISLRSHALFELSLDERKQFEDYVTNVTEKQSQKAKRKHLETLQHVDVIMKFPEHP